ncbi:MAG: 2-isopropylmalate synthase, partial [Thaumarchaeota archaeon]|nr:2-isopropylmalate synthase [Nitrososphaerota archaeon]
MQDSNYFANVYNELRNNGNTHINILDSTLREGEQHPGVSFTNKQRIQIAWMLDYFGVSQIEISPIVSPDHEKVTKTIIKAGLSADIVAHCRALKQDIDVALKCDAEYMAMYLGISDIHLSAKLRINKQQALERAIEAVDYMKAHGLKGRFTVEDASRADPEYLKQVCKAISDAGIDRISVPDTVGIMRPRGMYNLVKMIKETVIAMARVYAGADEISVTIRGIGKRTGIPRLAGFTIELELLYKTRNEFRLDMLKDLSKLLEQYTKMETHESKPIVGDSAFKHKAGTHLAAVLRNPSAYEII